MNSTNNIFTTPELIKKAKENLNSAVIDFIEGGAGSEWGVENNREAFKRYQIIPRVLQGVGVADTSANVLGAEVDTPILVAPCAFHNLVCEGGEITTAKACEATKTIFTVSTMASKTLETIATNGGEKWFQLYVFKDRKIVKDLIERAETSGYKALVVTVDMPAMGLRERRPKDNSVLNIEAANLTQYNGSTLAGKANQVDVKTHTDTQFNDEMSWDDIKWIKSQTKMPIVLKGILNAEDAESAIECGVAAIIVSNHGGRQIDGVIASIDALPVIAAKINNRMPILVDGGIRTGEDVFKAIALGATAVMIGRPVLWALAIDGENSLISMLLRMKKELAVTMQLAGCKTLDIVRERGLSLLAQNGACMVKVSEVKNITSVRKSNDFVSALFRPT